MANWSTMKRKILIGSLSAPNFAIRAAKMNHWRISFGEFFSKTLHTKYLADNLKFSVHENDLKNLNKCLSLAREFTVNGSREGINLSAILKEPL